MTAFVKFVPIMSLPSNVARSITAFVKSTPEKFASGAYTLLITVSRMFASFAFVFTINAPDSVFVDMSVFAKSHFRRSSTLSLTAFACPIVFPTNARSHRFGSVSIGGSRISARAGAASASAHASAAPANRVGVASSRASVVAGRARARVVVARRARAVDRRASAPRVGADALDMVVVVVVDVVCGATRRRRRAPGRPNVRTRTRKQLRAKTHRGPVR